MQRLAAKESVWWQPVCHVELTQVKLAHFGMLSIFCVRRVVRDNWLARHQVELAPRF